MTSQFLSDRSTMMSQIYLPSTPLLNNGVSVVPKLNKGSTAKILTQSSPPPILVVGVFLCNHF